jgi:hypothetical protein
MIRNKGFLKPKKSVSRLDQRFHKKNKIKLEPRLKVPFEIKNQATIV